MSRKLPSFLVGMALVVLATPSHAGLVNSSFDDPHQVDYGFANFRPGDKGLTGWTVEAGGVGVQVASSDNQPLDQGIHRQLLNLNAYGYGPGTISQVIQAQQGSLYRLSFDYSGYIDVLDGGTGSSGNTIYYQIFDGATGQTLAQGSHYLSLSDLLVWNTTVPLDATATSSSIGVRIRSDGLGSSWFIGPTIDAVSLELAPTSVPEPSSAILVLIAGVGAFAYRLRR